MSWASNEIVGVLAFLLPGFVAAGVFHSLTAHPRPDALAQVVRALVFTAVGYAATAATAAILWLASLCPWFAGIFRNDAATGTGLSGNAETVLLFVVTILCGLAAAWISNTDAVHRFLRWTGITSETSHPTELHSAFAAHPRCHVVLHLEDRRRLYGWPEEWPSRPGEGYFRMTHAEWLTENEPIPAAGTAAMLVAARRVEMIEFVKEHTEESERT